MRFALLLLLMATPAIAAPRAVIVGRVDGGTWSDAATEARIDQKAELSVVVVDRRGGKRVVLAPAGVEKLKLGGRAVPPRELVALSATSVKWSTVEPHGFRKSTAKNGATSAFYSN